jgi:hypothetical protein
MGNIKLKRKGKKRITMVIRPGKTIKIAGVSPEIPEQDFHLVKDFFDGEPVEEKVPVIPDEKKEEKKRKPTEHTEGHGKQKEVKNAIPNTKES